MMKKVNWQKGKVNADETYLQGINLITGVKIDYNRSLQSESEINALCINEKMSKLQKITHLILNGEKIQKWSAFQNINIYLESMEAAEKIFSIIEKNYQDYQQFIAILGEAVALFLKRLLQPQSNDFHLSFKCHQIIYRLLYRTLTNPKFQLNSQLSDWFEALSLYFQIVSKEQSQAAKIKLEELKLYINGSFSMNTLPQRRRAAFELTNILLMYCEDIENECVSRIVFFNNDLNYQTRLIICSIMLQVLKRNNKIVDVWKCVSDYFWKDTHQLIKERAFFIISTIYYPDNFDIIFNQLDSEGTNTPIILANFKHFIITDVQYRHNFLQNSLCQTKIISFLNRLIKVDTELYLPSLIQIYGVLSRNNVMLESSLIKDLQIRQFELENVKIVHSLILFERQITHLEYKQDIRKVILKGLRYHQFQIKAPHHYFLTYLLELLNLQVQEEIFMYMQILVKLFQNSKWYQVQIALQEIQRVFFFQSNFQKMSLLLIKIFLACPYFLIESVIAAIIHLMLSNRRSLDFFLLLKDKLTNSKNCQHRRNYMMLYCSLKKQTSFQFNKNIPLFGYKNVLIERSLGIRLEFIRSILTCYQFLDPALILEKVSIRESLIKFTQDSDQQLRTAAEQALSSIKKIDSDPRYLHDSYSNSKHLFQKQQHIQQVQVELKKHIKTDKYITDKEKEKEAKNNMKGKTGQQRNSLNFKEVRSVVNIDKQKILTSNQANKNVALIRCNSTNNKNVKKLTSIITSKKPNSKF